MRRPGFVESMGERKPSAVNRNWQGAELGHFRLPKTGRIEEAVALRLTVRGAKLPLVGSCLRALGGALAMPKGFGETLAGLSSLFWLWARGGG